MYRFDMGTPGSPVREGYTQVFITDIYSPELSFGWSRVASTAFDRTETLPYWLNWGHNNPKRTDKKVPHWAPINLLTRDGIQDPDAIEFRVDVPDGEYWVRVTCGDPFRSCMHLYWSVNGDTVMHDIETRTGWGGFVTDRTTRNKIRVRDGKINISFSNTAKKVTKGELTTFNVTKTYDRDYEPVNSINAITVHPAVIPALTFSNGELLLANKADKSTQLQKAVSLFQSGKLTEATIAVEKISGPRAAILQAHLLTWIAGHLDYEGDLELVQHALTLAETFFSSHPSDWDSKELAVQCEEFILARKRVDVTKPLAMEDGPIVLGAKRLSYADDGFERFKPGEALYDKALFHNIKTHKGDQSPLLQNPGVHSYEWILSTLLKKYPDNEILRIYNGEKISWGEEYLSANVPANAPQWAVLSREILSRCNDVVSWWIENRQEADGSLGGGWGDDCEILRRWPVVVYCGDSKIARSGVFKLIDGLWDSGILTNGYETTMSDVEHSAEPSSDTQPLGILLEYGNPKYVERNMMTMQLFEKVWSGLTPGGNRHFKSNMLGAVEVKNEKPYSVDVPYHGRAMRHGEMLVWYNRHTTFLKLYHEWMLSWARATARSGATKPAGLIPAAICFENDSPDGHGPDWTNPGLGWDYYLWPSTQNYTYSHFLATFLATGDKALLGPLHSQLDFFLDNYEDSKKEHAAGSPAWAATRLKGYVLNAAELFRTGASIKDYDELLKENSAAYTRFLITGNEKPLLKELEQAAEKMRVNFPKMTSLVLYTDRMPFFPGPIYSMYTGGLDMNSYPTYHVTWESVKTNEFAAFVTSANEKKLRIKLYNFDQQSMLTAARLWRLEPGMYNMTLSVVDNKAISIIENREFNFTERGAALNFNLPSQKSCVLELEQIYAHPKVFSPLADLAMGREDVVMNKESGKTVFDITVHNIGIARSDATELILINSKGMIIASAKVPPIDWPDDLEAKTALVTFSVPVEKLDKDFFIEIDPEIKMKEAVRLNNRIAILP